MIRNPSKAWCRYWMFALGISVGSLLLSNNAWAQLKDYKTVVTFNTPVEVPGSAPQVLPPGTYLFKVVDSKVNRNIVQISNKDENHVYTTILAVPTRREVESDKTVMTFEEREAGKPQALRAWFYPYEKQGQEFVYSKSRATELAKSTNSPVPYSESGNAANVTLPVEAAVPVAEVAPAPIAEPSPILVMQANGQSAEAGPYTQQAQAETQNPAQTPARNATLPETDPAQTPERNAILPKTASNFPLYALIGCLLVVGGFSIRGLCGR